MKKIILIAITLLTSTLALGEDMKATVMDTFSDKIKDVTVLEKSIEVTFQRHAAIYKITGQNPKFEEYKTSLAKIKEAKKKINVTATIPAMEIKEIKE